MCLAVPRFNPCCIGLDNDAMDMGIEAFWPVPVSILVVLDWTMMLFDCVFIPVHPVRFQSLLYWIGQ